MVYTRLDRIVGVIAFGFLLLIGKSASAATTDQTLLPPLPVAITQGIFPPGDIKVTSDGGTSGQLLLQFEHLDPRRCSVPSGKAETLAYMIAGVPGKLPAIEVVAARYTRYLRGRAVETVHTLPPQSGVGVAANNAAVRISELGQLRHLQVFTLTLVTSIIATDPGWQDSCWVLRELRVRIDLGSPIAGAAIQVSPQCAASEAAFMRYQVLNADITPDYWIQPAGFDFTKELAWSRLAAEASERNAIFRFSIYAPGFYRITPEDLRNAVPSSQTTATIEIPQIAQWRLYFKGQEIPAYAPPDGGALILPVAPDEFQTPNEAVYWLRTSGDNESTAPLRLEISAPPEVIQSARQSTITLETVAEKLEDYHARLRPTSTSTRFYWKSILPRVTGLFETPLPMEYDPSGPTSVDVLYGISNYATAYPAVRLFANAQECGVTTLTSQQGVLQFSIPRGVLRPGANTCGLRLEFPADASGGHDILIQSFEFRWGQPLSSTLPTGFFQWEASSPSQTLMLPLKGPASAAPLLAGFNNRTVSLLRGGLSRFKSVLAYPAATGASSYCFLHERSTTGVSHLRRITDFHEVSPTDADYIAVAAPELLDNLHPLLNVHSGNGHRVLARDVTSIFDQFNYGHRDGEAIRRFVRFLFQNANVHKPQFLLLVGECSDYRGNPDLLPLGGQPDMVPTIGSYVGEGMHGDQGFAQIAGDDMLSDLAVGRLSVATTQELEAMLHKFEAYRTGKLGDWIYRAQFLMDDNDEFQRVVQQVIARSMAPPSEIGVLRQADFTYVPNLRVPNRRRSHEATAAMLQEFNYGAAVQNFFGHGGPNLWSHERLFHLMDLPLLHNENRLPLITCLSCDNAWMDYPVKPVSSSMGELLVRKGNGGAIGLFGPVAGASPYEHQTLVSRLMEGVYRTGERRLGSLTMYAKNMYYNETRSGSLPEQYVLLGDPALELRVPKTSPDLQVSPDSLLSGTTATIKIKTAKAIQEALVMARTMSATDYESSAPVSSAGRAAMEVNVDQPGSMSVQWNSQAQPFESLSGRVEAEPAPAPASSAEVSSGTQPELSDLLIIPVEPLTPTGDPNQTEVPVLRFLARNTGLDVSSTLTAFLRMATEPLTDMINIQALAPDATQLISFVLKRQLQSGTNELELLLVPNEGAQGTTDSRQLKLNVGGAAELEFLPGSARARSTTDFVQRSTVFLDAVLRNSGSTSAKSITLHALLDHPETGAELQTINDTNMGSIDELPPGEQRTVTFRWENALDVGEKHIFLVANRTHSIVESRSDNNTIAVPAFTLKPLGNFLVKTLETSPAIASPGEPVRIGVTVTNDSGTSRGPVDLEIGLRNIQTNETTFTRITLAQLGAETTVSHAMQMDANYNAAYATINPARELEEVIPEDNTRVSETMLALPLSTLMPPGEKQTYFRNVFTVCRTWNMDPVSTDVLEVSEAFTSSTGMLPIDPKWYLRGQIRTPETSDSQTNDNAWSFDFFKLEAALREEAGVVTFKFPVSEAAASWPFAIYANLAAAASFQGGPIGAFDAKFSDGADWHHFDFTQRTSQPIMHRALLTTTTLHDGMAQISIQHTSGTAVILTELEAVPQVGGIESPVIRLDRKAAAGYAVNAAVTGATPEKVWLQARTGIHANGELTWSNWKGINGLTLKISSTDDVMQWRVFVQPQAGMRPRINDVILAEQ
ncbi:MAG: C25 family cysteine peptidase [Candidatus Sumerlaeaceae bacterium]